MFSDGLFFFLLLFLELDSVGFLLEFDLIFEQFLFLLDVQEQISSCPLQRLINLDHSIFYFLFRIEHILRYNISTHQPFALYLQEIYLEILVLL